MLGIIRIFGGLEDKESTCSVEDQGLIPGSGRSPGEGNGNLLPYSCLDKNGQRNLIHGVAELDTTE